jgi:hypothetical protein
VFEKKKVLLNSVFRLEKTTQSIKERTSTVSLHY